MLSTLNSRPSPNSMFSAANPIIESANSMMSAADLMQRSVDSNRLESDLDGFNYMPSSYQ